MFKWGISLISFDEADGSGDINSDAGNDVLRKHPAQGLFQGNCLLPERLGFESLIEYAMGLLGGHDVQELLLLQLLPLNWQGGR